MSGNLVYGLNRRVTEPGSLGIGTVTNEGKIRFVVTNAGLANVVRVRARIVGQTGWTTISDLAGSVNVAVDVFTYDEVEVIVLVYASNSDHIIIVAQSFDGSVVSINTPDGGIDDVNTITFTSSDDSVTITSNPGTGTIDFVTASGGGTVTSVNGDPGPVVVLDKTDIGLGNVDNTSDLDKPISTATQAALDLKANLASFGLLNLEELYADAQGGDDTTGVGSVVFPFQTIEKIVSVATDTSKHYVVFLAPGAYSSGPITIPSNISIYGKGASFQNMVTIDFLAGAESTPVYEGLSMQVTMDMSTSNISIATFRDGQYDITRTDATVGPYFFTVTNSNVTNFSLKGNALFTNIVFVGTGTVENDGQALMQNCIQGTNINVIGTGVVSLTACTFSGSITGTIDSGNTPTVRSDSSSLGYGGTILVANVVDLDSSSFISYSPATPGNWLTPPTEVKSALDELAGRVVSGSTKYTQSFVIADWVVDGAEYKLDIPAATHLKGLYPLSAIYETVGLLEERVETSTIIDNTGLVTIKVSGVPDLRFDGLITIS